MSPEWVMFPDDLDDPPRRSLAPWSHDQSNAWRPEITGWSTDILPWHREIIRLIPNPFVFVELGVFRGRSALHFAELASSLGLCGIVHGVDPGYAIDFGHPYPGFEGDSHGELLANIVRTRPSRRGVEILIHRLTSVEAAKAFANESVDMVFIDANHERPHVAEDIVVWTPKVKTIGGIVAGHDLDHVQFPGVREAVEAAYPGGFHRQDSVWWVRR